MKIIFLGTASLSPLKDRNPTSVFINYKDQNILVDCPEGTQRQLRTIGISPTKVNKVLITHWHGDHVFGLVPLLQTMVMAQYHKTLEIFGPRNSKKFLDKIMKTFVSRQGLKYNLKEINKNGKFFENEDFYLEARKLDHATPCLGYALIEKDKRVIDIKYMDQFKLTKHPLLGKLKKGIDINYKGSNISAKKATILKKGKKISVVLDTKICKGCFDLAKNSDVLIIESTFLKELENLASERKHLTAEQAALIAKKSNVKNLYLTHFSQRYKNTSGAEKEAKSVFKNTICAKDFTEINL